MEQLANLGTTFFAILVGAGIFALVSAICGYSAFFDLDYPKALALCGTIGVIAFLLSDIPQGIISIGKAYRGRDWELVEQALKHITALSSYNRLIINGVALAFTISGLIGSDVLLNLRKFLSQKQYARVPVSEWDALLWLYANTGDEVIVYVKEPARTISGALDFRSMAGQPQAILLRNPRSGNDALGAYLYLRGSEISGIALKNISSFSFPDLVTKLRSQWPYVGLFAVGLVNLMTQINWPGLLSVGTTLALEALALILFMLTVFLRK